jgi:hypothetical protein
MSAGELECAQAGRRFPITGRGWVACRRQARGTGSVDPMPTVMVRCRRCRSANVPSHRPARGGHFETPPRTSGLSIAIIAA